MSQGTTDVHRQFLAIKPMPGQVATGVPPTMKTSVNHVEKVIMSNTTACGNPFFTGWVQLLCKSAEVREKM